MSKLKKGYHNNFIYDYNYIVHIGSDKFGFSKISNLVISYEPDILQEGGGDSRIVRKKEKTEALILEKGMTKKETAAFEHRYKNGQLIRELTIFVLGKNKKPVAAFFFEEGMITKRSFSNLDAQGGNIMIAQMEITHTGLKEIEV